MCGEAHATAPVAEEPGFWGKVRVYVRFLSFLRPHRRKVVLLVLLAFVGVPLGKAAPLVTKFLVDIVLLATGDSLEHRGQLLVLLLLLQVVLWLSGEYVRLAQEWMGTYFWTRLCIDLSRKVYGHMHRLSADFFLTRNVGEHMYRANSDITQQSTQGWMAKGGAVKLNSDSIPSIFLNLYNGALGRHISLYGQSGADRGGAGLHDSLLMGVHVLL